MFCYKCGHTVIQCETQVPNYVGQLVFVEAHRDPTKDPKTHSTYYNGEYYILRQTPSTLYGVKIDRADEYNGREIKQIPLIGESRYDILSASPAARKDVEWFVRELWRNATRPARGEKLQWVESVYTEAQATAQQMARMLNIDLPDACDSRLAGSLYERVSKLEQEQKQLKEKLKSAFA